MTTLREAAQQALEALEGELPGWRTPAQERAITALKAALAEEALQRLTDVHQEMEAALEQPEQEPVAWMCSDENLANKGYSRFSKDKYGAWNIAVFTHPPRREWRGLTEKEHEKARHVCRHVGVEGLVLWLGDKLKEKNHE